MSPQPSVALWLGEMHMSLQQAVRQRSALRQRLGRATRHGDLPFNGIVIGASILVFSSLPSLA